MCVHPAVNVFTVSPNRKEEVPSSGFSNHVFRRAPGGEIRTPLVSLQNADANKPLDRQSSVAKNFQNGAEAYFWLSQTPQLPSKSGRVPLRLSPGPTGRVLLFLWGIFKKIRIASLSNSYATLQWRHATKRGAGWAIK